MKKIDYKNIRKNIYEIDEYGNIYSSYKKDFLCPTKDKDGYLQLSLCTETPGKRIWIRVATLVLVTFVGLPPIDMKDPTVNHIDSDISNNHYTNLEWMERSLNTSIRKNKGEGENNSQAKLKENQVKEICELLISTNLSLLQISKQYNCSKSTISNIQAKKTWRKITNNYDFSCRKIIRNDKGQFEIVNINLGENNV